MCKIATKEIVVHVPVMWKMPLTVGTILLPLGAAKLAVDQREDRRCFLICFYGYIIMRLQQPQPQPRLLTIGYDKDDVDHIMDDHRLP